MNIAGTELNFNQRAFERYLAGCGPPHCMGCHNPELWNFDVGTDWKSHNYLQKLSELIKYGLVEYVWILGGEPLHQNHEELKAFLGSLRKLDVQTVLWTRHVRLPEDISQLVDYAKVGPYIPDSEPYVEPIFGIKLANLEQKIIKIRD